MAEIGNGYGSEFQLLRFLGHHRNELNRIISDQANISNSIDWIDFDYDNSRISLDREIRGIEFLESHPSYELIKKKWNQFWPGNTQNWDGIFINNGVYYIVEAKAHLAELKSSFSGTDQCNKEKILKAFKFTANKIGIESIENWFGPYYQLANRLSFIAFLKENGINAKCLYIYFINGYRKRIIETKKIVEVENKNVLSRADWEIEIGKEYYDLFLHGKDLSSYLQNVFINCEK